MHPNVEAVAKDALPSAVQSIKRKTQHESVKNIRIFMIQNIKNTKLEAIKI